MTDQSTRRRFLRVGGLAGAAATAGCARLRRLVGRDLPSTATAEFRRGPRRLGYQPDASAPDAVTKAWRVPGLNVGDHTASKSSPVPTRDGDLVLAGDTGDVHAVTPGGALDWVAATLPSRYGAHATPAVAGSGRRPLVVAEKPGRSAFRRGRTRPYVVFSVMMRS